jgi:hypothetical protein
VRHDDGAARLVGFRIERKDAMAVLLLQPFRVADDQRLDDPVRPALLPLVVLGGRLARGQHKQNKKPAEAGFLAQPIEHVTQA